MIKELIINNLDLICTITIAIISFILTFTRTRSGSKKANVIECMINFIQEAEDYKCKNGSSVDGDVKKEIVLAKIEETCTKLRLKFNRYYWSALIDTYVEFTKNVNTNSTSKGTPISDEIIQEEIEINNENNITNESIDI